MASPSLTIHDLSILQKIADPESGPSAPLLLDTSLPKDPHYHDSRKYSTITQTERSILSSIQQTELQIAGLKPSPTDPSLGSALSSYQTAIRQLNTLISTYPKYASARNNRAQALKRVYGDAVLVRRPKDAPRIAQEAPPLEHSGSESELLEAGNRILDDLSQAIALLTPATPFSPLSPTAAKTLSQAYTQRGALYHLTAKYFSQNGVKLRIDEGRRERTWSVVDFEEQASRDFMIGGRLGNEVAKQMAVVANPTAKLCGDMVREAMRKEYAGLN
ncbi:uncharacterized protein PAC_03667 [Phialocephala subalpina]|uniref:Tetratricopeptide repeat protein 36 n=1 Tax=Phialocephala subalpina TaxID=576137 RepID=A0A1L7WLZ9_9HELO|nr:uncharacterized protein PAC_03667 [Phialocephala subalpina]